MSNAVSAASSIKYNIVEKITNYNISGVQFAHYSEDLDESCNNYDKKLIVLGGRGKKEHEFHELIKREPSQNDDNKDEYELVSINKRYNKKNASLKHPIAAPNEYYGTGVMSFCVTNSEYHLKYIIVLGLNVDLVAIYNVYDFANDKWLFPEKHMFRELFSVINDAWGHRCLFLNNSIIIISVRDQIWMYNVSNVLEPKLLHTYEMIANKTLQSNKYFFVSHCVSLLESHKKYYTLDDDINQSFMNNNLNYKSLTIGKEKDRNKENKENKEKEKEKEKQKEKEKSTVNDEDNPNKNENEKEKESKDNINGDGTDSGDNESVREVHSISFAVYGGVVWGSNATGVVDGKACSCVKINATIINRKKVESLTEVPMILKEKASNTKKQEKEEKAKENDKDKDKENENDSNSKLDEKNSEEQQTGRKGGRKGKAQKKSQIIRNCGYFSSAIRTLSNEPIVVSIGGVGQKKSIYLINIAHKNNEMVKLQSILPFSLLRMSAVALRDNKCHILYDHDYFSFDINDIISDYNGYGFPRSIRWNRERVIWIGYEKNDKNDECLVAKLSKDVIKLIISFLRYEIIVVNSSDN